jgi:glycosyltransferase involved in cell wall biosynthesis
MYASPTNQMVAPITAPTIPPSAPTARRGCSDTMSQVSLPITVFMMDLLPTVPYYTGHLCAGLTHITGLNLQLGATRYAHDPDFFHRMELNHAHGVVDVAAHLRGCGTLVRRGIKLGEYVTNLIAIALRLLISKPDVLHVQFMPLITKNLPFELWIIKLARALHVKVVYTVHNVLPHDSGDRHRSTFSAVYKLVDRFICHDAHAKKQLTCEFDVPEGRVSVIPHGAFFSAEDTAARASKPTNDVDKTLNVLCQGIIRPYKGISLLLKAWKAAQNAGLSGVLTIVGTGDKRLLNEIDSEVRHLALGSSVVLDFRFVSVEELGAYYRAADVLVYPYSSVTTSGALMTGISHCKPIIASDLPGFRDVLEDGVNALLPPYDDAQAWTNALLQLARDGKLRERLASAINRDELNGPSWVQIARDTADCYQTALCMPSIS